MKKGLLKALIALPLALTATGLSSCDLLEKLGLTEEQKEQVEEYVGKILSGEGEPDAELGQNKDKYTDTISGTVYEKRDGEWVIIVQGDTTYVVTFNLNGGKFADGSTTYPNQVVREGRWITAPTSNPTKEHCTFLGWYATGSTTAWNFLGTGVYGNVDLVAQWKVNEEDKVTITVDPNNGEATYEVETYIGDKLYPSIPTKAGYEFLGWYIDGGDTKFTGTVTSSLVGHTLIAVWEVAKFNMQYQIEQNNEVTITGILNIDSVTVTVPNEINGRKVTKIAKTAFQSRVYIVSINIPENVKVIEPGAFGGTYRLQEINVASNNVNYVSVDGILYNKAMTEICCYPTKAGESFSCPSSLKKIGDYAFYYSLDMGISSIVLNEGLEEIGAYAFYLNETISNFKFPSTLKKIGKSAFFGNLAGDDDYVSPQGVIQNNTLNEGLEEIGEMAFANQYFQDTFELPSTVKVLGDYAFANCNAIEKLVLPRSLESFGKNVFAGCTGILELDIQSGSNNFAVVDSILYNKAMTKVVMCPSGRTEAVTIPEGVTELGDFAFYMVDQLQDYTFPSTLRKIGEECFAQTYSLNSFVIPDTVTEIGEDCFYYSGISSITIGTGLTEIPEGAFDTTKLTEVVIPGNIKKVGYSAFGLCSSLKSVTLNEGVEELDNVAFYQTAITELNMPNSLKKIGNSCFASSKVATVSIGSGLESLGSTVFTDSNGKVSVTSLTVDANNANFKLNGKLLVSKNDKVVYFGASSGTDSYDLVIPEGVELISDYAFASCKDIASVSLPSTLVEIGEGAFYNLSSKFKTVSFGANLKKIGEGAFASGWLTTINFVEGLEEIGDSAFVMNDVTEVVLPNSVKKVGAEAFNRCMSLTSLTLGTGLEEIGDFAFADTKVTSAITIPAATTSIGKGAFSSTVSTYGAKYASFAVDPANQYFSTDGALLMDKAQTKIIALAGAATSVTIPSTVTEIADYGMAACKSDLASLVIPATVTKIGDYGLAYLTKISTITVPSTVAYVGQYAFAYWISTQHISFGLSRDNCLANYHKYFITSSNARVTYAGE